MLSRRLWALWGAGVAERPGPARQGLKDRICESRMRSWGRPRCCLWRFSRGQSWRTQLREGHGGQLCPGSTMLQEAAFSKPKILYKIYFSGFQRTSVSSQPRLPSVPGQVNTDSNPHGGSAGPPATHPRAEGVRNTVKVHAVGTHVLGLRGCCCPSVGTAPWSLQSPLPLQTSFLLAFVYTLVPYVGETL